MSNNKGALTVTNSSISDNNASKNGGGLYNNKGTLHITGTSILAGNVSTYGGGIYDTGGTATLENASLTGNTAQNGAGLYANKVRRSRFPPANFPEMRPLSMAAAYTVPLPLSFGWYQNTK